MSDGKYIYTEKEVRMMWQRSKPEQIQVAQAKCLEAIVRTGGQLAVSFSGGKDSAVLLYIMAQMWSVSSHKDKPLRVFFSNTTNEFGIPDIEEGYYQKRAQAYEEKNGGDGR